MFFRFSRRPPQTSPQQAHNDGRRPRSTCGPITTALSRLLRSATHYPPNQACPNMRHDGRPNWRRTTFPPLRRPTATPTGEASAIPAIEMRFGSPIPSPIPTQDPPRSRCVTLDHIPPDTTTTIPRPCQTPLKEKLTLYLNCIRKYRPTLLSDNHEHPLRGVGGPRV